MSREELLSTHPVFTARHYNKVARILQRSETIEEAIVRFSVLFALDNPRFDREKFIQACAGEEV